MITWAVAWMVVKISREADDFSMDNLGCMFVLTGAADVIMVTIVMAGLVKIYG